MTPRYWQRASSELARADPVLARLVERFAGMALVSRGDAFATLLRSIVGQQISVKAADSVWARLLDALSSVVTPRAVLASERETLRACGLSQRKVEYVFDLAQHFASGQIHVDRWTAMSDAEIIAELTAVRGIGVWTAEMFLIFHQLRPDVFPLDDIGLQKAVALHYCQGERPGRRLLAEHGERWRPWRSVATWYLWRSLDPLPVEY
ncbi:MAG TPA: DNA-3-methyladenine glycosylase [Accumulibacter sp.]|mgnify:FL=1|uniref:DNA-3-methyladenine glycosylase family protein n=1 Tax=Accumulibacter sp. TaxID=2053492 RepID=UPI0025DE56FD|nr:DNA-3-methyladenine glycosylase [Accumulibacter sp.]MCM8599550.1 DNA-3-methyladenine glycosylase [Accumulibacter sp.]MCM8663509.1 DNA-3-methyladenine glycosylase [Accumulibacter sp.]HNC50973.1 DNA-3-methyladenine glycosylase [Accumulibacter sp.]